MLKISVVTPTYNQARYLEECLLSVKEQNYPNVEHIVVDDGSTDNSREILKRWASTPGWEHLRWGPEPHCGQCPALNTGFRMATGDIVGWVNSDDRYRPACFQTVADAFQAYPKADIIYGDFTCIDEIGRVLQIRREIRFSGFVLSYNRVPYVSSNTAFFRRRVFDEGHFIDPQFDYAMDYEFYMRLARKGYRFKHISHLLADFRWHPGSKTVSQGGKGLQEIDEIALIYSPILRRLPMGLCRRLGLYALRTLATLLRYSEKLLRGYYFSQFRPSTPLEFLHFLRRLRPW